jgi:hypothetical protein
MLHKEKSFILYIAYALTLFIDDGEELKQYSILPKPRKIAASL